MRSFQKVIKNSSKQILAHSVRGLLCRKAGREAPALSHSAFFSLSNAGDVLLPVILKDLFSAVETVKWKNHHVHVPFKETQIRDINKTKALVIGGGGLFLSDTNRNNISGWQWSCSLEQLQKISSPIVLFAVGYNRFPHQPDFPPIFNEHFTETAKKSLYIGLRNHGSMEALKRYLPEELHYKIRFQPCMTTVISRIYSDFDFNTDDGFIALNCAFDRANLRFGDQEDEILNKLAQTVKKLSELKPVKYYSHMTSDEKMLPYLDRHGVEYELVKLKKMSSKKIIKAYSTPSLVLGMRGHAQLIPFGCNTPIVSLVSHDKLQFFLDDIEKPEWGVNLHDTDFDVKLEELSRHILNNRSETIDEMTQIQERLWDISVKNVTDLFDAVKE